MNSARARCSDRTGCRNQACPAVFSELGWDALPVQAAQDDPGSRVQ